MRIASLGTASVDQRTTQSDEKHNIHFKQKTAALTLSTLYFSIKFSCSMLLYVVCSCIALYRCHSLPAQPCGWCAIRTLRVGRHHPRRLDLSLSLSLSLSTLPLAHYNYNYLFLLTFILFLFSSELLLSSLDSSARCLCFRLISCAQSPNTG